MLPETRHRHWRGLYRALSVAMPRALREKHGAAMVDLFATELDRRAGAGVAAVSWTALVAIVDLLHRGLYERVVEERIALTGASLQLLRRLARNFLMSFALLTGVLVANYMWPRATRWSDHAMPLGTVFEALILAIPFTAALTLPMAIFIAVLATASSARVRLRLAPLIGLTSVVALFAFAWNAEVVPRANARLVVLQTGRPTIAPNDRSMTLTELRMASRRATPQPGANATPAQLETVAHYGIEMHKKPAIAAACTVLALLALGISGRAPRARIGIQVLAGGVVFTAYYAIVMTGESLAAQLVIPPAVGMWGANVVMLGIALMLLRRQSTHLAIPFIEAPRSP